MCESCGWSEVLERVEVLEDDERFRFAHDFLFDVGEWIEENEHVTDGQIHAIENIEGSVE